MKCKRFLKTVERSLTVDLNCRNSERLNNAGTARGCWTILASFLDYKSEVVPKFWIILASFLVAGLAEGVVKSETYYELNIF